MPTDIDYTEFLETATAGIAFTKVTKGDKLLPEHKPLGIVLEDGEIVYISEPISRGDLQRVEGVVDVIEESRGRVSYFAFNLRSHVFNLDDGGYVVVLEGQELAKNIPSQLLVRQELERVEQLAADNLMVTHMVSALKAVADTPPSNTAEVELEAVNKRAADFPWVKVVHLASIDEVTDRVERALVDAFAAVSKKASSTMHLHVDDDGAQATLYILGTDENNFTFDTALVEEGMKEHLQKQRSQGIAL